MSSAAGGLSPKSCGGAATGCAQSLSRGAVDARDRLGHRLGGDAARLWRRLPQRHRRGLPRRLRQRRRGDLAGADQPAGRRRARRPARASARRGRRGAARRCRWSAPPAPSSSSACRWRTAIARRCTPSAASTPPTARCAPSAPAPGQGRFIEDGDVEERRRVAFLGREVYRKLFGGRPAVGETVRIAGPSVRGDRRDGREGADVVVLLARRLLRVHPVTRDGAARRRAVPRHAGLPERRPAAAAAGDPSGARGARRAGCASTRPTSAR